MGGQQHVTFGGGGWFDVAGEDIHTALAVSQPPSKIIMCLFTQREREFGTTASRVRGKYCVMFFPEAVADRTHKAQGKLVVKCMYTNNEQQEEHRTSVFVRSKKARLVGTIQ